MVESADSTVESADSTTDSAADPVKIGLWVRAFKALTYTSTFAGFALESDDFSANARVKSVDSRKDRTVGMYLSTMQYRQLTALI